MIVVVTMVMVNFSRATVEGHLFIKTQAMMMMVIMMMVVVMVMMVIVFTGRQWRTACS